MKHVLALALAALGLVMAAPAAAQQDPKPSPQEQAQDVCQAYCDCINPGAPPATVDDCIAQQCLPSLPPVTNQCLDCVFAHDQVCGKVAGGPALAQGGRIRSHRSHDSDDGGTFALGYRHRPTIGRVAP